MRSTSSSSTSTTAILQQIKRSMAGSSDFGQSSTSPQLPVAISPHNTEGINDTTPRSRTPTPMKSENLYASNASTHTSSAKRHCLSPPSNKTTPTSTRRGKLECTYDAIQELEDLGKKKLNIAEQMLQRELDAHPKIHSILDCMVKLNNIPNLSLEGILSICEAFKDERNISIFMSLSGNILYMWIDRQVVTQRIATGGKAVKIYMYALF